VNSNYFYPLLQKFRGCCKLLRTEYDYFWEGKQSYNNLHQSVGFEVLMAGSMKMAVFWVVAPCSLVITNISEVLATSETSVNFYQTTQHRNPEDSHLHLPSPVVKHLNNHSQTKIHLLFKITHLIIITK
jgi:hypothetical protein